MRKGNTLTICGYCGNPLWKWTFQIKRSPRHFCNMKCRGKWMSLNLIGDKACNWRGGSYSTIAKQLCNSRYRRIRKTVLFLDNYKCVFCGSSHRLESHHIIEKGTNPALIWDVTNMITLCKKCHCKIRGKEKSFAGIFNDMVAKRVNSVKPHRGNTEPSIEIANRLNEGVETRAEETIMPMTPSTKVMI